MESRSSKARRVKTKGADISKTLRRVAFVQHAGHMVSIDEIAALCIEKPLFNVPSVPGNLFAVRSHPIGILELILNNRKCLILYIFWAHTRLSGVL